MREQAVWEVRNPWNTRSEVQRECLTGRDPGKQPAEGGARLLALHPTGSEGAGGGRDTLAFGYCARAVNGLRGGSIEG